MERKNGVPIEEPQKRFDLALHGRDVSSLPKRKLSYLLPQRPTTMMRTTMKMVNATAVTT